MIKGILIGKDFGNQTGNKKGLIEKIEDLKNLYNLEAYTYSIEGNKLKFKKLVI